MPHETDDHSEARPKRRSALDKLIKRLSILSTEGSNSNDKSSPQRLSGHGWRAFSNKESPRRDSYDTRREIRRSSNTNISRQHYNNSDIISIRSITDDGPKKRKSQVRSIRELSSNSKRRSSILSITDDGKKSHIRCFKESSSQDDNESIQNKKRRSSIREAARVARVRREVREAMYAKAAHDEARASRKQIAAQSSSHRSSGEIHKLKEINSEEKLRIQDEVRREMERVFLENKNIGNIKPSPPPRYYGNINIHQPKAYWDFLNHFPKQYPWGHERHYKLGKFLGGGKFGKVYICYPRSDDAIRILPPKLVLKQLKEEFIRTHRIRREIRTLEAVQGGPNIIRLYDVLLHTRSSSKKKDEKQRISFIFEHINNIKEYKKFFPTLTDMDVRFYIRELIIAVNYVHSCGIIHRDVKPYNTMIDHEKKILRLIDFGLAEFYRPGILLETRVASLHYKAPELLCAYGLYDYSVDSWSIGCILASMLFHHYPFFEGNDHSSQIIEIVKVVGTETLREYVEKYNIDFMAGEAKDALTMEARPRKQWREFTTPNNEHMISQEAFDLLDQLLEVDHTTRLLPRDALHHSYFKILDVDPKYNFKPQRGERHAKEAAAGGRASFGTWNSGKLSKHTTSDSVTVGDEGSNGSRYSNANSNYTQFPDAEYDAKSEYDQTLVFEDLSNVRR